jgi:lysophospholipase L1-like esterase
MLLPAPDPRLSYVAPQAVARDLPEVRLVRFPRQVEAHLTGQIGPLANLRSSTGCGVRLATDSPWIAVHLARLRHHQPVPQSLGLEVGERAVHGPDLRPLDGDCTCWLPTGLERGGPLATCTIWLPPISTCAIAGLELADGSRAEAVVAPAPRWLAIGDSLTQGFSVQSPLDTWVHRASTALGLSAWNLGVGGIRIEPAVFAWALAERTWDLVTIALGSNHIWKASTVDEAADRAAALAELALAGGHGRVLWLLPPWKPMESGQGPAEFQGMALDREVAARVGVVREALRARLATYAPRLELVGELLPRDHRLLPDGLHPEAHGAARYAEAFIRSATGR